MDKGGGDGAPKEFGEPNNLASGEEDEKKKAAAAAAAAEELRIEGEYEKPKVGTPQEVVHLIAWAALLMLDVQCCKRAFRDLIGRLIELGPIFANFDQPQEDEGDPAENGMKVNDVLMEGEVVTRFLDLAASLRRVAEIMDLCREPSLQLHLIIQHEEILKQVTTAGGEVGSKAEGLINHLLERGVNVEAKALIKAVNAAYKLQHVMYSVDENDREAYDRIRFLIKRNEPSNASNASSSEVSTVDGEPLELFSELLLRRASSGSYQHKCNKDNAAFNSMCEKVNKGETPDSRKESAAIGDITAAPRKPRTSVSGVWTRPQPLSVDATVSSPRVLWEVDTPSEESSEDWSLENFRSDDERTFEESFYKNAGKGKSDMDPPADICNMDNVTCDPPPPKIQDVTAEETVPVTYVGAQRRVSFIPGQGGQRRQSYLDGVQSPVRKCQRHSRRSYLAAGEDAPWEYLCPITRELMVDPVTLSTGQTYDRAPITKWINDGHYTCPVTGLAITSTDLLPNYALRHAIGRWAVGHNIKLPEPENVPQIQARNIVTPTQRLLEWGQTLPDLQAPITVAVAKLYCGTRKEQESALKQLCDMAKDGGEEGRCAIAEAGAIPMLIFQVQHVSSLASELAARCLRFLCRSTNVMVTQAASSAIPFLVALLHEGTPDAREAAAGALVNLSAKNEVNKMSIAAAGAIPWLTQMLDGKAKFSSFTTQEIASAALCNMSVNEQNRIEIGNEGAIPLLVQVVKDCPTPEAGEYAAHALGSLACDNLHNASLMIEAGAAEVLVAMVGPGTPWTQEAAARALRNISFHESLRPALCEAGAVQQLNALLEYSTPRAADAGATALWNLTPQPPEGELEEKFEGFAEGSEERISSTEPSNSREGRN